MFFRQYVLAVVLLLIALSHPAMRLARADGPDADGAKAETPPARDKPGAKQKADRAFRAVQRSALLKMRSKVPEHRTEAFEQLKNFPTVDCAKLLVQQGMKSSFDDVRKAACDTLSSFRGSDEVCAYLLSVVEKDISKGMPSEATCVLFSVPLSSETPDIEKQAFDLFDKAAAQKKGGMLLLVSLADYLGTTGGETSVATLSKISERPLFSENFGIRRSVVQALTKIEEPAAVDALISILGKLQGEARGDIVRHLTAISGEQFGIDPPAWEKWWKDSRENFQFAAVAARAVNRAEALRSKSMYHGLPIYAARLVFVIDTSGSMRGPPIVAAKKELINAINALPEGVYFNVLAFDRDVKLWQRKLTLATEANRKQAAHWVTVQGLGGATASYDALEAALDLDTEAIYFLTDGAPHGGKVVVPAEIVEVITRLNFTRRVTINAIGFGLAHLVPADFLTNLAKHNFGEYRAVAFGD